MVRIVVLLALVLLPLVSAVPVGAQSPGFHTGDSYAVVEVVYQVTGGPWAPFNIEFYRSPNRWFDGDEILLDTVAISDAGDLSDGIHVKQFTLGTDLELMDTAPGAVNPEVDEGYRLMAVHSDHSTFVYNFEGVYQYPYAGSAVFAHGTEFADTMGVTPGGRVSINGWQSDVHALGSEFRLRAHSGDDTLSLNMTPGWAVAFGGNDHDTFYPGPYQTEVYGMAGIDTVNFGTVPAPVNASLLNGTAFWGPASCSMDGVENLGGSNFDDRLVGNTQPNVLMGGAGNDRIEGYWGNDTLYGAGGNDILVGDDDDDLLYGGVGDDKLYGTDGNDKLFGSYGHDIMVGGDGEDYFLPSFGDDYVVGGAGIDTVDFEEPLATNGVTASLLTGAATGIGNDTLRTLENILGTYLYNDVLTGNNGVNFITGRGGNDDIYGAGGNDRLYGGPGSDELFGGPGDDVMFGDTDACADDSAIDNLVGEWGTDDGYGVLAGGTADVFDGTTENVYACP
jgi:Ca2+-binding RTX toxin-like protein